jgi:tRNA(Ile)-lysidine synthase
VSSPADGVLDPEGVIARLVEVPARPGRYLVSFSGGMDSTVLLHLLHENRERLPAPVEAIHVDHGLQADSATWASHCRAECARLDIPLTICTVDALPRAGEGPEAAAREARYGAIAAHLRRGEVLVTAHHRDDQAETLLLQLMRGAGVHGLAAMPVARPWQGGWLLRPLIEAGRGDIRDWAEARSLVWIDDPSNSECSADRNFLRHEVLPLLQSRWPAAGERIAHSARLCGEAAGVVDHQAMLDLDRSCDANGCLSVPSLLSLDDPRARQLVRRWLRERAAPSLPGRSLEELLRQLRSATGPTDIATSWSGFVIRHYRDLLWLDAGQRVEWLPESIVWQGEGLWLGEGLGRVYRVAGAGGVDPAAWRDGAVRIVFRHAGMRCRPAARTGSKTFKKLAQEYGVPPWQRDRLPILLIDGEVAAVANCCTCEPFAVSGDGHGWLLRWDPAGQPEQCSSFPPARS